MLVQLDFFRSYEECQIIELTRAFKEVKDSADRVRKSQFAKIGAHEKRIAELEERLELLERFICTK